MKKRQVKSPKTYISDPGLLHALLGLADRQQLEGHAKVGASWEGFIVEQLCTHFGVRTEDAYLWGTHAGPEIDLVLKPGGRLHGFEIKRTAAPRVTESMLNAKAALVLDSLTIGHGGRDSFTVGKQVRAVAAERILEDL